MLRAVRRRRIALAVPVAVLALAGCGSGGPTDEQLVARAVTAFGRATAAKDYRTLCDRILAPSLIEEVTSIGLPCEKALERGLGGGPLPAADARRRDGRRRHGDRPRSAPRRPTRPRRATRCASSGSAGRGACASLAQ
jgi:hypothetical protein